MLLPKVDGAVLVRICQEDGSSTEPRWVLLGTVVAIICEARTLQFHLHSCGGVGWGERMDG